MVERPTEYLDNLSTKRLLNYYRAERKRFYTYGYWCDCGCDDFIWNVRPSSIHIKKKYDEHLKYLDKLKTLLDTREHIEHK